MSCFCFRIEVTRKKVHITVRIYFIIVKKLLKQAFNLTELFFFFNNI